MKQFYNESFSIKKNTKWCSQANLRLVKNNPSNRILKWMKKGTLHHRRENDLPGCRNKHPGRQLLPKVTTMRAGDRTCSQKLTIHSLEKDDSSSANLSG